MSRPRAVLVIGGSDSSGGAGIQADQRVLNAMGLHACTAITALTAQTPTEVRRIEPAPLAQLDAELNAAFDAFDILAVKTGMLVDAERVAVVAAALDVRLGEAPLVIDPVLVASSGTELLNEAGLEALRQTLLPRATLVTPNLPEARRMLGNSQADPQRAARALGDRLGVCVLVKGGHAEGARIRDVLAGPEGMLEIFEHPKVALDPFSAHGTGCRLAAGITGRLALGDPLIKAVGEAIKRTSAE